MKKKSKYNSIFNFFFKFKSSVIIIFVKILSRIIPKIDREKLIKIGKKKNTICIVENQYEV
jgi:hypothetical protein